MPNDPAPSSPTLWTIDEFASWMRISPMAVRCMLRRREVPEGAILKIGRRVRLRADMLQEWILKRTPA